MLLIGSKALSYWFPERNSEGSDWDFIIQEWEIADIIKLFPSGLLLKRSRPGKMVIDTVAPTLRSEFYITGHDPSDHEALVHGLVSLRVIDTPFGRATVAPPAVLKAIKLATVRHLPKEKHVKDLDMLNDCKLTTELERLVDARSVEIQNRLAQASDQFFNKYRIKRKVQHDILHKLLTKNPSYYELVSDDGVSVDEATYNKIPDQTKIRALAEEAIVLAVERESSLATGNWFLKLLASNREILLTPLEIAIKKLSLPGVLNDHPAFMARFATKHTGAIMTAASTLINEADWEAITRLLTASNSVQV